MSERPNPCLPFPYLYVAVHGWKLIRGPQVQVHRVQLP